MVLALKHIKVTFSKKQKMKRSHVTFSVEVELSEITKFPLDLNMCSDQVKLILNHLHIQRSIL